MHSVGILHRIIGAELDDIRKALPDCPESFALFLDSALSGDRRRRPSTARAFREQLEAVRGSLDR
jgi:hypothetical protein